MSRTSPNFSKMSDTYIPELMELNSYWQNAVEEAIQDTLKGEKRLYYALKNRKKIKDKLQKLGLKPYNLGSNSPEGTFHSSFGDPHALMKSPNYSHHSCISVAEDFSYVFSDPERSRSRSVTRGDTPHKYRNPDRPLLGDGSMEKMKKSQHDFNYEPMGMNERVEMLTTMSESDKEEDEDDEDSIEQGGRVFGNDRKMSNKKVEWIHMRENSDFEESDSEVAHFSKELQVKNDLSKAKGGNDGNVRKKSEKIPIKFDPRGDLFWENEVKNAIRVNANFERKLQLALAKEEIINEHQAILRLEEKDGGIKIEESEAKNIEKKRRGKKILSPFVRFYLDVYRELCLKCPVKEIDEEAARRWWNMTIKKKI